MTLVPALVIATVALAGPVPKGPVPNLGGLALPPLTSCANQTDLTASVAVQKQAMRCVINATRASAGLRPLRASRRLNRSASLRAAAIRRCDQFSHRPCGQSFVGVFVRSGYLGRSGSVGENLAWGESPLGTVRDTVADWLASAEHRANMLGGWRDVGVSLIKAPALFGAQNVTVWVLDFGRR